LCPARFCLIARSGSAATRRGMIAPRGPARNRVPGPIAHHHTLAPGPSRRPCPLMTHQPTRSRRVLVILSAALNAKNFCW
jgi:hypothetical protein